MFCDFIVFCTHVIVAEVNNYVFIANSREFYTYHHRNIVLTTDAYLKLLSSNVTKQARHYSLLCIWTIPPQEVWATLPVVSLELTNFELPAFFYEG